ncbi:MAG: tRNA (adenosine(37)-N6)-dimethylallyltransferase MiaA [Proteobacteria bacterium]|nr:tRNA (adenosine(37)-N6)-dimethylallyltransferase MiaA [Pseudomonadota bacterium]
MDKVLLVAGPTASGKSAFAYKLAQERNGVILNADSLQIYRGIEVLTAQPSREDQKNIPHRLYGFLDLHETFSVGRWLECALLEIKKSGEAGKLPIIVGGTGLYFKALLNGISTIPKIDPQVRQSLQGSQESLYKDLEKIDPVLASRISPADRQRTIRGLEVFYGTKQPLSFWQSQKPIPLPYDFEKYLLIPPKEETNQRIEARLETMIEGGVIEEVRLALSKPLSSNARKAIGLREFKAFLEQEITLEEAKQLIVFHTRQYAKRQRTWFRHQFF